MSTASEASLLVVPAATPSAEAAAAFDDLVRRFQGMAVATAYAVLRDHALAEDAAQDAFLVAWLNLERLREPEAFPAWFHRIVLNQCNRRLRAARPAVGLERASMLASPVVGPEQHAEQLELRLSPQQLLDELPEHERLTVLLFYMAGRSQKEIAAFLDVSVTAVKQRLFSARKKLKRRIIETMQDDLRHLSGSGSDAFLRRLRARLRPFESTDYDALSDLANSVEPDVQANAEWLHNRRLAESLGLERRAYIVQRADSSEVLAYGALEQDPSTLDQRILLVTSPRERQTSSSRFRLFLVATHDAIAAGALDVLYERLTADAATLVVETLWTRNYAGDGVLDFLRATGFVDLNRAATWHLEAGTWMDSRSTPPSDIEITSLASEQAANPAFLDALSQFWAIPSGAVRPGENGRPFDSAQVNARLAQPDINPRSYLIAKRGPEIVGVVSVHTPHPAIPDRATVWLSVQNQPDAASLPKALIDGAVSYAKTAGIRALEVVLRTSESQAIDLYEALGFRKEDEMVLLEKPIAAHLPVA